MGLRVLIDGRIFDVYPHGGIARIYREVLPRMAELHSDWKFAITVKNAETPSLPRHDRIRILSWKPLELRPARLFRRVNEWKRNRNEETAAAWNPGVFHSTYYTASPVKRCKAVAMVYDLIDDQYPFAMPNGPGFVGRQEKVLKEADAVVGISRATIDAAIARFGLEPGSTTTMHLDASPCFRSRSERERQEFRRRCTGGRRFFLFVGSTGSYKNIGTLIRAFGAAEALREHVLVLAGHSIRHLPEHLFDLAVGSRVEDRIVKLLHPADETLCLAYNAADGFVFPSLQEGFGIPLVEAMRCGTPVVASDIAVFREVCGDAALFFDPHDHVALARQLSRVRAPDVRARLVEAGFERARAFSWDRAAESLAQVYLRVAESS
ncbi:MAG: glycosyltransferase family 4 protein [Caldilineaceae bacterium]